MDGFSLPYRLDKNHTGGGVMIFVKEDILSKLLTKYNFPIDVEGLFVELNFRKSKWLLCGTYHPPAHKMISIFLIVLIKLLVLTATMFYLQEILVQKILHMFQPLSSSKLEVCILEVAPWLPKFWILGSSKA